MIIAHPSGSRSVRWNAIGLAGRQLAVLTLAVVLASLLGPQAYGILAQAQVFITLTTLFLDQGLSAALVQRPSLPAIMYRAIAGLNLVVSILLAALTALAAPALASFFRTPELSGVLIVLGIGLVIKGLGVVPRALLVRHLQFRQTAIADLAGVLVGGIVALVAAFSGLSYWSLVLQVIVTDSVTTVITYFASGRPGLNFRLRQLGDAFGFSLRVFASNLISYTSRNTDNILIGRFYGPVDLGFYSLAYRVLLAPVQMLGQVIVQVLFPHVARLGDDRKRVRVAVEKSLRSLATVTFPLMAAIGISSPLAVPLVLGNEWAPAVPVLAILAFTGARQAITSINSPLMLAAGAASAQLRFSMFAAAVQVGGICAGLPFGIVGVAWGYTIGGLIATPVVAWQVRKYSGVTYAEMYRLIAAPFHASVWMMVAYLLVSMTPVAPLAKLMLGLSAGAGAFVLVMLLVHRNFTARFLMDISLVIRPGRN